MYIMEGTDRTRGRPGLSQVAGKKKKEIRRG